MIVFSCFCCQIKASSSYKYKLCDCILMFLLSYSDTRQFYSIGMCMRPCIKYDFQLFVHQIKLCRFIMTFYVIIYFIQIGVFPHMIVVSNCCCYLITRLSLCIYTHPPLSQYKIVCHFFSGDAFIVFTLFDTWPEFVIVCVLLRYKS